MKKTINNLLMIEGRISDIRKVNETFYVDAEGVSMEFRNNRGSKLADHIKTDRMKPGDDIIALCTKNDASSVLATGIGIVREGTISNGDFCLVKGNVARSTDGYLEIEQGNENLSIESNKSISSKVAGKKVVVACMKSKDKYYALDMEEIV